MLKVDLVRGRLELAVLEAGFGGTLAEGGEGGEGLCVGEARQLGSGGGREEWWLPLGNPSLVVILAQSTTLCGRGGQLGRSCC